MLGTAATPRPQEPALLLLLQLPHLLQAADQRLALGACVYVRALAGCDGRWRQQAELPGRARALPGSPDSGPPSARAVPARYPRLAGLHHQGHGRQPAQASALHLQHHLRARAPGPRSSRRVPARGAAWRGAARIRRPALRPRAAAPRCRQGLPPVARRRSLAGQPPHAAPARRHRLQPRASLAPQKACVSGSPAGSMDHILVQARCLLLACFNDLNRSAGHGWMPVMHAPTISIGRPVTAGCR